MDGTGKRGKLDIRHLPVTLSTMSRLWLLDVGGGGGEAVVK